MDNNQNNRDMTVTNNHSQNNCNSNSQQKMPSRELVVLIAEMFTRWTIRYGNKMKLEDWGVDTVNDWAEVLTDLQITPSEFETAKQKSKLKGGWMISHPADFLELARGKATDSYPDVKQAYIDQANFKTDCPIAYETARRVGFSAMREQPEHKTYPVWQKHYEQVCIEHRGGAEFKKVQVLQIENTEPQAACDDHVSSEYLANLKAILAGDNK